MDLISVPSLLSFNYHEWKLRMITYLKSHEMFDVSTRFVTMIEFDDEKYIWFNNYDRAYGGMCQAIPPKIHYLFDAIEFPSEIWSRLEKSFGQQTEEMSTKHWERTSDISFQVLLASIISQEDEVLQDEEMTKSSTNSI